MKKPINALFQSRFLGADGGLHRPIDLDPKKHSLLIVHGGEDIHPAIYGEKNTHSHPGTGYRDAVETALITKAVAAGIPILGICRGAQLLCALGGGKLWQHVDGHTGRDHVLLTADGEETWTNTCHHQMMRPTEEMEVLATSPTLSPVKYNEDGAHNVGEEVEILHIPKLKAICVQGHPEWLSSGDPLVRLTKKYLETYNYL